MKTPVLTKYEKVDRFQCGVCKTVLTHELDMQEHMTRNHCPHNNVEGIVRCGDLDILCMDCKFTLGDFIHDRTTKFFMTNMSEVNDYMKLHIKLGGRNDFWTSMVKRYNKWWKK